MRPWQVGQAPGSLTIALGDDFNESQGLAACILPDGRTRSRRFEVDHGWSHRSCHSARLAHWDASQSALTVHVGSPGVIVADPIEPGDLVEPALNPPQLHLVVQFLRVGVFLLFCNDNPRVTTFSRDWAARAMDVIGRYFSTQSGRRQSVVSTVTDWIQLPITTQDWMSVSAAGIDSVRPLIEQQTGVAIENIDHVLIGIDVPGAGGGTTPGAYTYLAAQNFTPQLIAHELRTPFGADDAFRDAPGGPIRYENQFCAMGAGCWQPSAILSSPTPTPWDWTPPDRTCPHRRSWRRRGSIRSNRTSLSTSPGPMSSPKGASRP